MNSRRSPLVVAMLIFGFAFLYLPIVVLVVMSFNASKTPYTWKGFSLRWYADSLGIGAVLVLGAAVLA